MYLFTSDVAYVVDADHEHILFLAISVIFTLFSINVRLFFCDIKLAIINIILYYLDINILYIICYNKMSNNINSLCDF